MRVGDGSVGGDAHPRKPLEEPSSVIMDWIKNFILQNVPPIRRMVSERDQLIKERAEPKKRISRILTEKEVEYYK